jgi:hydrogenase nickel incorporation protein HypB
MCATCGCGSDEVRITTVGTATPHRHHEHAEHADHHDHHDPAATAMTGTAGATIEIGQALLAKNDRLAEDNRALLAARNTVAVNVMSSPGAGKTSLLERTIRELPGHTVQVVEGDQETAFDAERIRTAGAEAVQVNTGAGCHLDATMVRHALEHLGPRRDGLVFIENVGNLVCPALFDLGERARVVVVSVTEGDDKPLKYPHMFAAADLVVLNKTDLLPYVDFDVNRFGDAARTLRPGVEVMALSVRAGTNLDNWYGWLLRL